MISEDGWVEVHEILTVSASRQLLAQWILCQKRTLFWKLFGYRGIYTSTTDCGSCGCQFGTIALNFRKKLRHQRTSTYKKPRRSCSQMSNQLAVKRGSKGQLFRSPASRNMYGEIKSPMKSPTLIISALRDWSDTF